MQKTGSGTSAGQRLTNHAKIETLSFVKKSLYENCLVIKSSGDIVLFPG
jgi:hypothetical protein